MKTVMGSAMLGLGVVALLCFRGMFAGATAQPPAEVPELPASLRAFVKIVEDAPGDSKLVKILKERHNTAVRLLEERVKEYKSGIRDMNSAFDAAKLVVEAKLDLAADATARTSVLKQSLEVANLIEKRLQEQLDKGFGSRGDFERARLARLSVEVELERAKQK